jgi:hypothetical protein
MSASAPTVTSLSDTDQFAQYSESMGQSIFNVFLDGFVAGTVIYVATRAFDHDISSSKLGQASSAYTLGLLGSSSVTIMNNWGGKKMVNDLIY